MYDAIVIGVGGMGSAAVYHLARRGARTLGLEQFDIPHDQGSSHGISRIIRLAYWEHPNYVPLVRRALELWNELQNLAGERLLVTTGTIDAGRADSAAVRGALKACRLFHLAHDTFDGSSLRKRFPGYRLPSDFTAVYQPDGGLLLPERCIVAHVTAAQAAGADVHARERVRDWRWHRGVVEVRTDGRTYTGRRLVVTAGPWTARLFPDLDSFLSPERQVMLWVQPRRPEYFLPVTCPVFYMQAPEGQFYGFPAYGIPGFKIGKFGHLEQRVDPDTVDRDCHVEDERVLRVGVRRYFPDANGPTMAMKVCLFTHSPDGHFIIERLKGSPSTTVAAGFSGHGFKFCSVVGEILADLALEGGTRHDIELFASSRLRRRPSRTTDRH